MQKIVVDKPKKRSPLRLKLGKEYFILKRKLDWWKNRKLYSTVDINDHACRYSHKKHQSVLLRQLKMWMWICICNTTKSPIYA